MQFVKNKVNVIQQIAIAVDIYYEEPYLPLKPT